ncbi:MAG: purine-nucleoside phosphorylase [Bacteroidales bacterium]|jgi:purine-nucleoside phosphorylase|nr:purine-nucleoside phosphorylase [Bacteroidales bacterium]
MTYLEKIKESATFIKSKLPKIPDVAIVLGSGLGDLAEHIQNPIVLPYSTIPNFMQSTAVGHKGNLIYGELGGKAVLAMQGRFHYYEGYSMDQVTLPIRVMNALGILTLFVSNAAGGINPEFRVGDLMIIKDQINLMPNPLVGKNLEEFGPRFPDMTRPYDLDLIKTCKKIAEQQGVSLQEGVYVGGTGPSYETPAEYKYFRVIGGDAVGMSTVPEVIVARHGNMRVFGMSVITNEGFNFTHDFINDENDVVEAAGKAAKKMTVLFTEMIRSL